MIFKGWMWGLANICYFCATDALAQAVTFPIMSSTPQIVSTLWGVLVYKEIKGKQNFVLLLTGFATTVTASILIGLSF
jgi:glucose uptake protein GlcU